MLRFLPGPVTGVIVSLLLLINLLIWMVPVYALILLKLITWGAARKRIAQWIASNAQMWAAINAWVWRKLLWIEWDIRGVDNLDRRGQYLVVCNHQTWVDIPIQLTAFDRRAPFFKFFMKQQLIWVPILGLVWWGLDFPFMKRYTPEQIKKNPALKGKDLETTRKACEKYRNQPLTLLNFLEGTRFTPAKHARQESPYQHLLKPRPGGFAFVMAAMGDKLDALLDVTIVYPDGAPKGLWDLHCGRLRRVILEVRQLDMPRQFSQGDYGSDPEFRQQIKDWVAALWQEKDARIDTLLRESGQGRGQGLTHG